ncbi:hypothetical protein [Microbacterium sp. B35-30]|uniref:hypothetical protein n=1 Tax=Microbacterium sp. B35-30 TaxID=1962642 RepID=UPI0013D70268|nr:hypothetical protein [Microbacterium sp. B35-30]KAF2420813.1 hypothetical protein B2K11_00250 [Microbacterium sp. B35-30]
MSTPTEPPLDELRALRERAYGRHADIQDDPDALARLRELEAQASAATLTLAGSATQTVAGGVARAGVGGDEAGRLPDDDGTTDAAAPRSGVTPVDAAVGSAPPVDPVPSLASSATASDGGESSAADPVASAAHDDPSPAHAGDPAGHGAPPRSPWWRRRTLLLWAASVVAGVLVGVGLTLAVQAAGAGRVATLDEDADGEWPDEFFGARPPDARVFDDFHGLTVLTFRQPVQPGDSQTCLYIVTAPDAFGGGTCGADAFGPTASLEVGPDSPEELSDRFPRGTALQFVLEGSSVQVYAREPSLLEPTP